MIQVIRKSNTIRSTGKNENGRTPIRTYFLSQGKWRILEGELLDSVEDLQVQQEMNRFLEEIHREFLVKNAKSENSAKNVILTAAA